MVVVVVGDGLEGILHWARYFSEGLPGVNGGGGGVSDDDRPR